MSDRSLLYLGIPVYVVAFMLLVSCGERDQTKREIGKKPHVPAECSWKEIDQPGDWQQTCDDNQKRLQR